jgi:hypothetical protein
MKRLIKLSFALSIVLMMFSCGNQTPIRFKLVSDSHSGIDFNNLIDENDSINVFEYMNIYTGAGVAVGDVNNDGLTDVYFSGNVVSGRLYLNKGDLKFEDITEQSGLINTSWGTGVSMVDINQDGFLDIYVCVSGGGEDSKRGNLLYINEGVDVTTGEVSFKEMAQEYGLADTRQSMQAAFFDYDMDNDLDMYLLVNPAAYEYEVNTSFPRKLNGESVSNDRLYRNDGIKEGASHVTFTDVSSESGILIEGFGLGVGISDINEDHWPDIYISNDFVGNDILYINQKDGTFKDEIADYIGHTSYAGMGNDISDFDNNGKPDIVVLDMRPEDNLRQKMIISSTGYDRFQMMLRAGYQPQYSRNTLQLNQGKGTYSEIGNMAGISSTDWSWSPLFADFDNDGLKDLYVTNGFIRDLGDLDYINYQGVYDNPLGDKQAKIDMKLNSIKKLPAAKLLNYAYKNNGDLTFEKVTKQWGLAVKSCSSGSVFTDLDNDGDLDLLVNNMNHPSFVFQNLSDLNRDNHFLEVKLKGDQGNFEGIGAKLEVETTTGIQYYQHYLSRGYESSVDPKIHFGLGKDSIVKSLKIIWPDQSFQLLSDLKSNQLVEVVKNSTNQPLKIREDSIRLFADRTADIVGEVYHIEDEFVDFKAQPIIPHMHSKNGPGVAVADVNSDGLDDFYLGGAAGYSAKLFFQNEDGTFTVQNWDLDAEKEDTGSLFFDVDNDGDQDLYVVSGGTQNMVNHANYQDRIYINDGLGNFSPYELPDFRISGSVVTASDFDKDGDLDLFVGGRVTPGSYPLPTHSYLLENKTEEKDQPVFVNSSVSIDHWDELTMVTSALWTDYDNDSWVDLIVVGEFMPITLFHNEKGVLNYVEDPKGLDRTNGWWNSISGADFDMDGDIDYVVGNLGLNSKYQVSKEKPLSIYTKDYDKNDQVDPLMCYYIGEENYLAHSRDEIISQISVMKSRFRTYKSYADVSFEDAFLKSELQDAYVVKAYKFESSYVENLGDGTFELKSLPMAAQVGPIEGIVVGDFDKDGYEDVVLSGNSYESDVSTGRYDALKGLVMKGDGKGEFSPLTIEESGILNDEDASGMAVLNDVNGHQKLVIANNNGPLKIYENQQLKDAKVFRVSKNDQSALITLKNGKTYKKEFYFGSGYLSQSSRTLFMSDRMESVKFISENQNQYNITNN